MGASSGQSAPKVESKNTALNLVNDTSAMRTNPQFTQYLANYANGKTNLTDTLANIRNGNDVPGQRMAAENSLYTDPGTGSMAASDFVRNDGLTSGLFGKGGIQDQSQDRYGKLNTMMDQDRGRIDSIHGLLDEDREALKGKGDAYGLQNSDLQAYGQASSNVGRMFGGQEQALSQSLADRGLGAAPSGIAAQSFSGLNGNKFEQLAGLQNQISQNRIATAKGLAESRNQADLNRLTQANQTLGTTVQSQGQNNNLIQGLGQLGQQSIQNQYGRQLAGSENSYNQLAGAAGLNLQNQALQQNVNNSQFSQQQQTKSSGLAGALTGLAGSAAGSMAGAAGEAAGDKLGTKLGSIF